jgi:hypothetical protein
MGARREQTVGFLVPQAGAFYDPNYGVQNILNILLQMNEVLIYRLESIEVREGRIFLKG